MARADSQVADRNANGRRPWRRIGAAAVLMTSVALVAVGCSGDGGSTNAVASVPSGSSGSSATPSTGATNAVAFAACMRKNGLPEFKDPQPGQGMGAGIDTSSDTFRKAMSACQRLMPGGGPPSGNPDQTWSTADKLKYAKCMRERGLSKFPDPDANGGFVFDQGGAIDPTSSQFKKADTACSKYKPQNIQTSGPGAG